MGHEQVQLAIIVVVQKCCAGAPFTVNHTRLVGNIGEGPITVVVIQNVAPIGGHVQILIAVAVVVPCSNPFAVSFASHSCFCRHVCKRAIPVIAVKPIVIS